MKRETKTTRVQAGLLAGLLLLGAARTAYSFGLDQLGAAAAVVTGGGAGGGGAAVQIQQATVKFLSGSEKLATATGDAIAAKQYAAMRAKAEKGDLADISASTAQMKKIANNEAKLRGADSGKVKEAAVDVGVACLIQSKAVAALAADPKALAGSPVAAAGLLEAAPTNLESMLVVQKTLYSYLEAKGEDPEADARSAAAKLEKS